MSHQQRTHRRGRAHAILITALWSIVAAVLIAWAWNGAVGELFALPHATFAQIFAIVIAAMAALAALRSVVAPGRRKP